MIHNELIACYFEDNYHILVKKINARIRCIEDAEDIVMDAFRRALEYQDSYDEGRQEFGCWFNTILNNSLRTYQREKIMKHIESDEEAEVPVKDNLEDVQLYERMLNHIEEVESEEAKDVLHLFLTLGYQYKDIELVTGISVRNSRFYVDRFKQQMRERYSEDMCR